MVVLPADVLPSTRLAGGAGSPSERCTELDWLRGLMLVLMTVTHFPTALSGVFSQPFGFVSAAEGFVFLSAFLVGAVYSRMAAAKGAAAMERALAGRVRRIYVVHVALLALLFVFLVPLAEQVHGVALRDLASFYRMHPAQAVGGGLLLVYNPPLLDILPMYVLFLAATPWILRYAARAGWRPMAIASVLCWLLAQWGAGSALYALLASLAGVAGHYPDTGAFSFLAWQLLWIGGLWAGARSVGEAAAEPAWWRRPHVLRIACVVAIAFCAWRHVVGQAPFGSLGYLNQLFDKWTLGPLRLVDFGALVVVAIALRHSLRALSQRRPFAVLTTMGRAPLAVFCAHLVLCLVALPFLGNARTTPPTYVDALLLAGALGILYAVARGVDSLERARKRRAPSGLAPRAGASPAPRMAR